MFINDTRAILGWERVISPLSWLGANFPCEFLAITRINRGKRMQFFLEKGQRKGSKGLMIEFLGADRMLASMIKRGDVWRGWNADIYA